MSRWSRGLAVGAALGLWASASQAFCFSQASQRYAVPQALLEAVARVETGMRVLPPSRNEDGSYDIGLMRINSRWLPTLGRFGITREILESDHCISVMVGAWILAGNRARLGDSWEAVGAYNAGCKGISAAKCDMLRTRYSLRVYCAMQGAEARPNCYGHGHARGDGRDRSRKHGR